MMRFAASILLTFLLIALLAGRAAGLTVQPDPGPGIDTYKSDRYRVEIFDGFAWVESYTYMTNNPAGSDVWAGGAVHFTNFGVNGPVKVRISQLNGNLPAVTLSPVSKHIVASSVGGKLELTMKPYDKAWLSPVKATRSAELLLFANPLKLPVPPGARYYKAGVQFIGDHDSTTYAPANGEVVYLDAGAWIKGHFDMQHSRGARIMGPGILSGEAWDVKDGHNPCMINGGREATVVIDGKTLPASNRYESFTVVRAPSYNFRSVRSDYVGNVKLISPWRHSTDGFQVIPQADAPALIEHCFAFVGDDVFFPRESSNGDLEIRDCLISSTNNSAFQLCYWGESLDHRHKMYAHDIDIKSNFYSANSAVFRASINNRPDTGLKNMTFENINIEGSLKGRLVQIENRPYFWPEQTTRPETSLGNTSNLVFRNIILTGTQEHRSTLLGLNPQNGHHHYLFDHISIGGVTLDAHNFTNFLELNEFDTDIRIGDGGLSAPAAVRP
jgi:hypothetical protein